MTGMSRRRVLAAGLGGTAVVALGVAAEVGPRTLARDIKHRLMPGPTPHIPTAPEGQVRLEQVYSRARGRTVSLFTAVPHGYGAGAGLQSAADGAGRDPVWLHTRGFDVGRVAAWGRSMGGYGVLRLAEAAARIRCSATSSRWWPRFPTGRAS